MIAPWRRRRDRSPRVVTDQALPALARLRRRLTLWYVVTFACILLALGALLFFVITGQTDRQVEDSLRAATQQIAHAAGIREREAVAGGSAADAVEELHIPDRALFLFDTAGHLLTPVGSSAPPAAIVAAARAAARGGSLAQQVDTAPNAAILLYATRFALPNGHRYVAVAAADEIELEDRYSTLIWTFTASRCSRCFS